MAKVYLMLVGMLYLPLMLKTEHFRGQPDCGKAYAYCGGCEPQCRCVAVPFEERCI
ncbi:hypothetical protein FOZ62_002131, partial [Perkinsus olseni]